MDATMNFRRDDDDDVVYYNPAVQIYIGLWCLLAGASVFLALRLWCKITRRHGLWYDDYVLIFAYSVLLITDIIITIEYATGYSKGSWDDRMHMLINTSSIGTIIGQAVSKTAFGVTLLRMADAKWQKALLWFCIISMDGISFSKCIFQWAKYCGEHSYQQWYRIQGWCLNYDFEQQWKEIGNIYNIVMDFLFAIFPWFVTWPLNLKRAEKIGLCVTLSLGMIVAIITAVRTWWKDTPLMHVHDEWYMCIWSLLTIKFVTTGRDAMSEIWYSAEVAGTIIVQCIPVLRPFIKDLHTSLTSRRLEATEPTRDEMSGWRGSTLIEKKGNGSLLSQSRDRDEEIGKSPGVFELSNIPEEPSRGPKLGHHADAYYSPSEVDLRIQASHTKPLRKENWPL